MIIFEFISYFLVCFRVEDPSTQFLNKVSVSFVFVHEFFLFMDVVTRPMEE